LRRDHRKTPRFLLGEGIVRTLPGTDDFLRKRSWLIYKMYYAWGTSLLTAGVMAVGIDNLSAFIQSLTDLL